MTRTLILTLAAAAALAGCNNKNDHTIVAGADNEQDNHAVPANLVLPPAIEASKAYRCKDNHLIYVDWLADDKSANIRTEKGGSPTSVVAAEAGKPMTNAGGYSLTGSPGASSIALTTPANGAETCKA
ncbi:MAG: hypothetical protein V4502_10675 [Pseudomonadota bacterium]